jgi:SpoVK/Ycf46/Vps4 family AAA+-type ATPase
VYNLQSTQIRNIREGFKMAELETTTIRLTPETKALLDKRGDKGDTYEDIVRRLLEQTNKIKAE